MIDIHIDKPLVITMNTYQVNSVIHFIDSVLLRDAQTPAVHLEEIPNDTPILQSSPQPSSPKSETPVTSKFNLNAVSLWIQSISFIYYMPTSLLPFSQQKAMALVGEDKNQVNAKPSLLSYAVPKSLLKTVFEVSINAIEVVANLYDNQFYTADLLLCIHDVLIQRRIHYRCLYRLLINPLFCGIILRVISKPRITFACLAMEVLSIASSCKSQMLCILDLNNILNYTTIISSIT